MLRLFSQKVLWRKESQIIAVGFEAFKSAHSEISVSKILKFNIVARRGVAIQKPYEGGLVGYIYRMTSLLPNGIPF